MKLLKFILPITAMLMVFAVVESTAQICVYDKNTKYSLADVVANKCNLSDEVNLKFLKFCCDSLGKCSPNYFVDDKYMLTHIAAKYNRKEVLEYLVNEKDIPANKFPVDLQNGGYDKTYTPVMFAALYKGATSSLPIVKFLVETYGYDIVTVKNKYNEDALILSNRSSDAPLKTYIKSAWNKAKGYSYNQIEQEKTKLRNLLKPEAIQKHFAQNTVLQTTKPFIQSTAQTQEFKQI